MVVELPRCSESLHAPELARATLATEHCLEQAEAHGVPERRQGTGGIVGVHLEQPIDFSPLLPLVHRSTFQSHMTCEEDGTVPARLRLQPAEGPEALFAPPGEGNWVLPSLMEHDSLERRQPYLDLLESRAHRCAAPDLLSFHNP